MAALAVVKGLKEKRTGAKSDQATLIYSYIVLLSKSHISYQRVTRQPSYSYILSCCQILVSLIFLFGSLPHTTQKSSHPPYPSEMYFEILIYSSRRSDESWTFLTTTTTTRSGWRTSSTSWMSTTLSSTQRRYHETIRIGCKLVSQKSDLLHPYPSTTTLRN